MLHSKTVTLGVLLVLVAGCASRDASRGRGSNTFSDASVSTDAAIAQTELEGAYTIASWTINSAGCDFEGPSVFDTRGDRFAFVRHQSFLGESIVSAGTCTTRTECESEAFAADNDIRLSATSFDRGSDSAGWEGDFVTTSWSADSECNGTVKTSRMTWDGASITLRTEERSVSFAQSGVSEDECPPETAKLVAQTTPCEALEVLTASPL